MKKNNKTIIIFAFIGIAFILLSIWWFAYRPIFSGEYSSANSEWGGFGDFFWGLGTMLLTAVNVIMVYKINSAIDYTRQVKDKSEIQREIINEYKSLRDKCLFRDSSDVFHIDTLYIAPMESFIRELRGYGNVFPFLSDELKAQSLKVLQERLRLLQDQDGLNRWKEKNGPQEWDLFYGIMYSHSEWILGNMTCDWGNTVNKAFENSL